MLVSLRGWLRPSAVLVLLALSSPALAQNVSTFGRPTIPTKAEAAEAKRRFDTGLRLFKEKNFDAALPEFRESYKLGRRATALRNLGQSHRELQQFPEAYEAFEFLLAQHSRQLKPQERREVQRALKELASVTGNLTIKVAPEGSDVALDGKSLGTSPVPKRLRVTLGRHTITAQKAGFDPAQKDIELAGGQELTVDLSLAPEVKVARVKIRERNGADVRIVLDDRDVGTAPWEGDLEEGEHTLEVRGPKVAAPIQTFHVKRKEAQEIVVDAMATATRLRVVVPTPKGSRIAVDDRNVGQGIWEGEISSGEHTVKVTAPGYKPHQTTLSLGSGETRTHEVILTPVDPPPPDESKKYWGMYARFDLSALFDTREQPKYLPCDGTTNRTCAYSRPPGGSLLFRLGYSFDWFAIEGAASVLVDYRNEEVVVSGPAATVGQTVELNSAVARTERFDTAGIHGFLGGGFRLTSHGSVLRFTTGFTPGFSFRNYFLTRSLQNGVDGLDGVYVNAGNFGFLADAGLLLGKTPGFKATLGVLLMVDFPGTIATEARAPFAAKPGVSVTQPSFVVASGTQLRVGPALGFQFGS